MTRRAQALALLAGLLVLGLAVAAEARPGGGHSYSGSSSSSSRSYGGGSSSSSRSYGSSGSSSRSSSSYSGGGGGSAGPYETIVLLLAGCGALMASVVRKTIDEQNDVAYVTPTDVAPPRPPPPRRPARIYEILRESDPNFSAVLLEDFVYALYARVHGARNDPAALAALAPYVADEARAALARREPRGAKIHGVVIGRMEVLSLEQVGDAVLLDFEFESNYTAELPAGPQGYYIHERWTIMRAGDTFSRPPDAVLSFNCPACGAPYVRSDAATCSHCKQPVENGWFDWRVKAVRLRDQEPRPPALTGETFEQGTGLPTVTAPDLQLQHTALLAEDPAASEAHLERRLHDIYHALNTAWTACDLRSIRPHVSDALFNYLTYWIDAYRAQGLRNVLKDMEISRVQLVKLTRDRHFDAITVRFWASGLDYTVDQHGRRVAGDPTNKRIYSEYWTLIRGAAVRGAPRDPEKCPGCGAALDRVSMAGNCEYCGVHLTRGEFDWVLSKIQQDESYTG